MGEVYFCSDLHLGHRKIRGFRFNEYLPDSCSKEQIDEHDEWQIDMILKRVTKRDTLWVLGDVVFDVDKLKMLERIPANKKMIFGNHDKFPPKTYLKYFDEIHGFQKKYGFWLSHAPIHPFELRDKINIHGHVHHDSIKIKDGNLDPRYINVSVDALLNKEVSNWPISLMEIRKIAEERSLWI